MCIVMGAFVLILLPLGTAIRGPPSMDLPIFIAVPFAGLALIGYGITILKSKTSDIKLSRWDLGRK
jgi:hypothetical protein